MKLAVVSSYFDTHPGGLETIAGRLAVELAARGRDVVWLATDATPAPTDGVSCVSLPSWNGVERRLGLPLPVLTPRGMARLDAAVRASDAVLIHDTLYSTSICAFLSAKVRRKPVLLVQHLGDALFRNRLVQALMRLGERFATRPMLASADQVAFISNTVADHFHAVALRRPAPVTFSGVDVEIFHPPADTGEKARLRSAFKFPPERPLVLYVGRFVETKGLDLLRRLAARRPDMDVAMAGWGPVDPTNWGLANVRVVRGLSGAPLADLYRCADVFLLPSPSESLSLVIREALACGLPIVCSDAVAKTDPLIQPHVLTAPIRLVPDDATVSAIASRLDEAMTLGGADERAAFVKSRYAWSGVAAVYDDLIEGLGRERSESVERA